MNSLNVNDEAEGASALSAGTSGESRGAGDPVEATVSSAGWARIGIAVVALPEVTAELFLEAGEALARRSLGDEGDGSRAVDIKRRANVQAAVVGLPARDP